jgi:outer membrane biosynthesis protein TonB
MVRDFLRSMAASLLVSSPAAWTTEPGARALTPDVPARIRPAPPEQFARCFTKSAPRTTVDEKVQVVATISPDGKAGNLRFPLDIESWQEETARCVMGLLQFDPATHDGEPVAMDVSVPLILKRPAAPSVIPPRLVYVNPDELTDCYARSARRAGAEGRIQIGLTIEPDGRVSRYELPPGIEPWQKVTAECVIARLRFEPATRDGVPFTTRIEFPLNFALEGTVPLTLAKLVASDDEVEAATRHCYPADRQETATSQYRVTVNVRGWPSQVMLVESSGDKKLDHAGACVIKKLRFEPAKRGEQPVMSTLLMPITLRPPSGK